MVDYDIVLGYSLAEIALILIWSPMIDWFNTSLPATAIGVGLGSFFWILMSITFMYLMSAILSELLGSF